MSPKTTPAEPNTSAQKVLLSCPSPAPKSAARRVACGCAIQAPRIVEAALQQSGGLLLPGRAVGKRQNQPEAPRNELTMREAVDSLRRHRLLFRRAGFDRPLAHRLKLVDHTFDDLQALVPELGIAGIEAKRREQLRMVLRPPCFQEVKIFRNEARMRFGIKPIERVHEAVAEGVGVT